MSDMFGSLRNREVRSNWNRQSACYSSSIVSCLYKLQQQSCSFPRRGHNGELQYHHLHTPSHTLFITASQFFGQKRVGIFFQSFFMQISFRLQSPNWDSVLGDWKIVFLCSWWAVTSHLLMLSKYSCHWSFDMQNVVPSNPSRQGHSLVNGNTLREEVKACSLYTHINLTYL